MANVSLKTDFKDGDILYDYHLNNNFAAIQAALGEMNKIVWQDNADAVVTFRGTTEELAAREIINGQILYDTTTGESYIDYDDKRISTGSGNVISIGDDEPTNPATQLWIETDSLDSKGTEVTNEYSESTRLAYSANYVNNNMVSNDTYSFGEIKTNKIWIDEKPIYRKVLVVYSNAINFDDYTRVDLDEDPLCPDVFLQPVFFSGYIERASGDSPTTFNYKLDQYTSGVSNTNGLLVASMRYDNENYTPFVEFYTDGAFEQDATRAYFIVEYVKYSIESEE